MIFDESVHSLYPLAPRHHSWPVLQIEPGMMCEMRIRKQTDISERDAIADQPTRLALGEAILDAIECLSCGNSLPRKLRDAVSSQILLAQDVQPVAQHGDAGFVVVLLEEHPTQHFCALEGRGRD